MIKSQEEKDYLESVCRPPHIYHFCWKVDLDTGEEHLSCNQLYGSGTSVEDFVNCKKCLRILDRP